MTEVLLSRRDGYGSVRSNAFGIAVVLGSIALALWGMLAFPWFETNDSSLLRLVAVAYAASLVLVIIFRKRLFPWREAFSSVLMFQIYVSAPVVPTAAIVGAFTVGNAVFDRGQSENNRFVLVGRAASTDALVVPIEHQGAPPIHLQVGRNYQRFQVGGVVRVTTKPGLFHHPWVVRVDSYEPPK